MVVSAGVCGFTTTVKAEKTNRKKVKVTLDTECEMVSNMGKDLETLDMMAVFTGFLDNPVYRAAAKHLKHVSCPVPSAVLKAVEVELELALPRDVEMRFVRDNE